MLPLHPKPNRSKTMTIEERVLSEYDNCKTYKENLRMYQGRHGYIGQCVYFGILRSHGITRKMTDRKQRRERLKASVKNAYNPNATVENNMARLTELTGFRFVSPERYKNKLLKSLGMSNTSPYRHDNTISLPNAH